MGVVGSIMDIGNGQRRASFLPGSLTGLRAGTQISAKTSQAQVAIGTVVNIGGEERGVSVDVEMAVLNSLEPGTQLFTTANRAAPMPI